MPRLAAIFVLIFVSPLSLLCQSPSPKSAKALSWEAKGRALIQAGKFTEAIDYFNALKRSQPNDGRPYFYVGIALLESGKLTQAASELEEATRLSPGKVEYLLFKANVHSRLGQNEIAAKSVDRFNDTSEISKLSAAWMWLLADVYYRCNKPDDALRVLDLLGEKTPADSKVDLNRGQAYLLKGQLELARQSFQKSLNKNSSNNAQAHYELGKLLHQLSEIPAAKQSLLKAVRQEPDNPKYAYKLATVCLASNEDAEALRYLQRVGSSGKSQPEIYYALARAYRKIGKEAEGDVYLKKFQESNATARKRGAQNRDVGKLIALGERQLDHANKTEARRLFQEALEVDPQDWSANGYLAEMYLDSSDQWEKAYSHLVRMEEVEPDSVIGSYLMAKYWCLGRDFLQARDYAERARTLRPANSELRNLLGNIYLGFNRYQDAVKEYEAAVQLAPDRKDFQQNLDSARSRLREKP